MLSLQYIREHPDEVRRAMELRHTDAPLDQILELDAQWRRILQEVESLRWERNAASKRIGAAKDPSERQRLIQEMRAVSDRISALEEDLRGLESRLNTWLLEVPNLVHHDVPAGPDETANVVVCSEGELPAFAFRPLPHWELGERLDIIDFQRGAKLSGSRFYILKGLGARLQRALITFMLDMHIEKHGYREIYPPAMVKEECMWRGGWLPKFADNMYHDAEEDYWFLPTAEVALTNLHRDEIMEPGTLPLLYVSYTPCFRREKMSAGRDVRGIKRGHQFDKVEMYKFCEPEKSDKELASMVQDAQDVLRALGLHHRVVQLCSGDLGFNAAMTYDIEAWAPGCGEWLEVSSLSNCTDFQARRANIRFRREPRGRPEFVHTLNGSGLALPRTLIAVLENYQQPDGSVVVPPALRPYMGGVEVIH